MPPVYLDCAATTPMDPRAVELCLRYMRDDYGNAHSRTHSHGTIARRAVEQARDQIAGIVSANRGDVIFTSGATESNNLAIFGMEAAGRSTGRMHIVSTAIEHRAILEPLQEMERRGFPVTLIPPQASGAVDATAVLDAIRPDTLLVSVMHINNETGAIQPIHGIADRIPEQIVLHTDASQGFAKSPLRHPRIDLISVSGHKICGPKGVGALIARRRGRQRPALAPLLHGGGQERGLRPGTLPVSLIAAFGLAAELWTNQATARWDAAATFRARMLQGLAPLKPVVHGDPAVCSPFLLNLGFPGFDSEGILEAWSDLVSVSDGAACSSQSYTCSHVLSAMGVEASTAAAAIRFSWCHLSQLPDLSAMVGALQEVAAR